MSNVEIRSDIRFAVTIYECVMLEVIERQLQNLEETIDSLHSLAIRELRDEISALESISHVMRKALLELESGEIGLTKGKSIHPTNSAVG